MNKIILILIIMVIFKSHLSDSQDTTLDSSQTWSTPVADNSIISTLQADNSATSTVTSTSTYQTTTTTTSSSVTSTTTFQTTTTSTTTSSNSKTTVTTTITFQTTTTTQSRVCLEKLENLVNSYSMSRLNNLTGHLEYSTNDLEFVSINYSFPVNPNHKWPVVCNKLVYFINII